MKILSNYKSVTAVVIYQWVGRLAKEPFIRLRSSHAGWTSRISMSALIVNSHIGAYCYVSPGVMMNKVRMGNYCSIAPYAQIGGMEHSWWWGSTSSRISRYNVDNKETIIEDDVWIGANAFIRQGLNIGRGAVVAAGSVVLKNLAPYTIAAGVPAKNIKKRFTEDIVNEIVSTKYWDYPPEKARALLDTINYPKIYK